MTLVRFTHFSVRVSATRERCHGRCGLRHRAAMGVGEVCSALHWVGWVGWLRPREKEGFLCCNVAILRPARQTITNTATQLLTGRSHIALGSHQMGYERCGGKSHQRMSSCGASVGIRDMKRCHEHSTAHVVCHANSARSFN